MTKTPYDARDLGLSVTRMTGVGFDRERIREACATREDAIRNLSVLLQMGLIGAPDLHEGFRIRLEAVLPVLDASAEDCFDLVAQWILDAVTAPKEVSTSRLLQMVAAYRSSSAIFHVLKADKASKEQS